MLNIIQDNGTIYPMVNISFKVKESPNSSAEYAEFIIEPLESGYGHTLGAAMRRVLLTSIPGVAVTMIKIAGAKHKFSELPGLKENVVDLLLNIKGLNIRLPESQDKATLKLTVKGAQEITAGDIQGLDGAEVVNKDHYIGSLSGEKAKLDMELTVERGYGYSLAEERQTDIVGAIQSDAVFSPVRRVSYSVEATRVGRRTNLDKLILQVWTNGSVTPREALDETAKILSTYFMQIYQPQENVTTDTVIASGPKISDDVLKMTVDELDLPTRIYNSLRNGGIETVGQLLTKPRKDVIALRNMGVKSITIIEEKLREKGISLKV